MDDMTADATQPPDMTEIVDVLARLLMRFHPDTDFDAYMCGIDLLLALDHDIGISTLGWLHDYGPNVVEYVDHFLGIPVAEIPDHSPCSGCGLNVSHLGEASYMVLDDVWQAAGNPDGYLCVGCLEDRLGRRLGPGDFNHDVPYTSDAGFRRSVRLTSRIAGA
jgi:hypothetical protein